MARLYRLMGLIANPEKYAFIDSDGKNVNLGRERNGALASSILKALAQGLVPVVAMSFQLMHMGGVRGILNKYLGPSLVPDEIHLYVPEEEIDFSREKVLKDLEDRNSSGGPGAVPADVIPKLLDRLPALEEIIEKVRSDATHVRTFGSVFGDLSNPCCKIRVPMSKVIVGIPTLSEQVQHVTIEHGCGGNIEPDCEKLDRAILELQKKPEGRLFVCSESNGKRVIKFIVLDSLFEIKPTAHVTVNPGVHKPVMMNDATASVLSGMVEFDLEGINYLHSLPTRIEHR